MSFSFSLSFLIRYQENWWASDTELSGEQSRRAISYDTALKVFGKRCSFAVLYVAFVCK